MALEFEIPGWGRLELEHLVLDQNGTLSDRGELIDGVEERISRLRERIQVHILSADTFGTLGAVSKKLGVRGHLVGTGADKAVILESLGVGGCVAIGNGRNDIPMFSSAALAIAVLGPEGTNAGAAFAAHVVCPSILVALDLLLEERLLVATLRE